MDETQEEIVGNVFDLSDEDLQEKLHYVKIIETFKFYRQFTYKRVTKSEKDFMDLPVKQQNLVPSFLPAMKTMKDCIELNAQFLDKIAEGAAASLFEDMEGYQFPSESASAELNRLSKLQKLQITTQDMDKLMSTLKQIVRDWSREGQTERDLCYSPVINEVKEHFRDYDPNKVKILVPGAGLGRLAWELARLGYACQGNEWSLHMLLTSFFILNRCSDPCAFEIYPWVTQTTNVVSRASQYSPVKFPDVNPNTLPKNSNFSMVAGDFLEVYKTPDTWDCVATVFFIDTARNILDYLDTIWNMLKPGGIWINLGPLLYHYSGELNQVSIDLSYEELRGAIEKMHFKILKENFDVRTTYTENFRSMLKYEYSCCFSVMQKPLTF